MSGLLWIGFAMTANAEDSTFAGAQKPPEEKPEKAETHVTGELGGSFATGNSNFYTVNGLLNATHKVKKNQVSFGAGLNLGGAKPIPVVTTGTLGTTTAAPVDEKKYVENVRRLFADARYDRFLSEKDSLYVLAGAFHDKYAGYDIRAHEQLGYSRLLVKNDKSEVKTELGFDWAQEDYFGDPDPNYQNVIAARVLGGFTHNFNDKVSVTDTLELYENLVDFEDLRLLNTAAVTSTLSGKLSLKVSHALIFDNVPVEGFEKLDQTTMVTLVISLL
ncbi:MAG: DUF481 domain-containing protein [Myxococcota bacterium]